MEISGKKNRIYAIGCVNLKNAMNDKVKKIQ